MISRSRHRGREKRVLVGNSVSGLDSLLVEILNALVSMLRRLRSIADEHIDAFRSEGFKTLLMNRAGFPGDRFV